MIKVVFYRQYHRLTIRGHAHSGEPGQDLVCAGVSTLAYTLAANVGNLQERGQARNVTVLLDPGDAEIACEPKTKYTAITARIFAAVCVGFEILAANHPDYISYEIHG